MYQYKKTAKPKNTLCKACAAICLLFGALIFAASKFENNPSPILFQLFGVILIAAAIYLACVYLIREYSFSVENSFRDGEGAEKYDFIINERRSNKSFEVCHINLADITLVRILTKQNRKEIEAQRKNEARFIYDTCFAANKRIEIKATVGGEKLSVIITYDEELFNLLSKASEN